MQVLIENKKILFGDTELEYYPYYFSIWKEDADHRQTVKVVLSQWADALDSLRSKEDAVYLPYYLDDETCRYLKAELDGEDSVLTDMLVRDAGYDMDLDDLSRQMYSAPEVLDSYVDNNGHYVRATKFFGRYRTEDLIEALRGAEINISNLKFEI
ncbi:MAG: hypothetical protein ABI481_04890 [Pyrinomonadaceae bacterium]